MTSAFTTRHIGTDANAQALMLNRLGFTSLEELMSAAVPGHLRMVEIARSVIPPAASEAEALVELRELANANTVRKSLIGLGYYATHTPNVIKRNVLQNPSWYTAYTPYQPEISQGRLEALLNFQTMVADLTGMATANASMLDEATAVAEAMLLARRASGQESNVFVVDRDALPQTKAVLAGRAEPLGIELVESDWVGDVPKCFGMFVQYPGASGRIVDPTSAIEQVHAEGGLAIMAADILALTLLKEPAQFGADIAVGTTQRFGIPLGFGGPHAGYLAVRAGLERQMPGRLIGVSKDADGNLAYRLTLQTREQHIRRDKATSNICTAQVLLAVMAGMYAVYHGPDGLAAIATAVAKKTAGLRDALVKAGLEVVHTEFFDTLQILLPGKARETAEKAREHGVLLHTVNEDLVSLSLDETCVGEHTGLLKGSLEQALAEIFGLADYVGQDGPVALPAGLVRTTSYLEHPVFHTHRSETSMMRYLKSLADKDYALDRGMIPLGSCTMKLNSATEMEAVTWPEFGGLHPFAPLEDTQGYLVMMSHLEQWLAELTGYDSVSLQPNAGSQGEYAGLLAIRSYHRSRGDDHRTVCLIPQSAHGTNAASAVLAGMTVVVVACNERGDVDFDDVKQKIAEHAENLAALMVTYPSTHGVYEPGIRDITDAVHQAGGQVYIDGANLNALVGYARYGDIGGDVSHLNLHKTFCIPHGGGGPGVGPVGAKAHLAPFLPGHPFAQMEVHPPFDQVTQKTGTVKHQGAPVSAAPYGSPSILPIPWAYVRMMGPDGLAQATASAVLAANYIAARLADHYPILYTGENGLIAHEAVIDIRPITQETGVGVDDIAKRLVDYGFHAPTMSFPVPGTLMIEPTESEDLGEIERFIDAMIAIREETIKVLEGVWPAADNPLCQAPHTASSVTATNWEHPYSREIAAYPAEMRRREGTEMTRESLAQAPAVASKYWPPVRRVDQAFGDRNLVCACPPIEAFA
jgi:glycine dehydrogenase